MTKRIDPTADLMSYAYRFYPASPLRTPAVGTSSATGFGFGGESTSGRRRLFWALVALCLATLTAWGGLAALSSSDAVTGKLEERIGQSSGFVVSIRAISLGLGNVELHGLQLIDDERGFEIWADVARLDVDVQTLRDPSHHDLPAQLDNVRVTLSDGTVFTSKRLWATRRADGTLVSHGRGEIAGRVGGEEGRVEWDVTTDAGLRQPRGRIQLTDFPAKLAADSLPNLPAQLGLRQARLDGQLRFEFIPSLTDGESRDAETPGAEAAGGVDDAVAVAGQISVRGLEVRSERLTDRPIRDLELAFDGSARWSRQAGRLDLEPSKLTLNGVDVNAAGRLTRSGDDTRLVLAVNLPETGCDDALDAIPAELMGEYDGFRMAGVLSGRIELAIDTRRPNDSRLDIQVDDQCDFRQAPPAAELRRFDRPFRLLVVSAEGDPLLLDMGPGTPAWVDLNDVSPYMIQAVMAHEDATFFDHHGFAVFAIENSLKKNLEAGAVVRGASTISMQLAKNLFLDRDKTFGRKAREAVLTWWLERSLSKSEIMELYLNVIEFGPDLYGLRPAARHYFGVEPHDLTPAQSVFLATLLPNPVDRHRQFEQGALTASTRREVDFLLRHMHRRGRIRQAALDYGLWELGRRNFFGRPSLADRIFGPDRPDAASPASVASIGRPPASRRPGLGTFN